MSVPDERVAETPRQKPKRASPDRSREALKLKEMVQRYFDVYDVRWDTSTYAYFVHIYDGDYGKNFEKLRRDLKKIDHLPKMNKDKGEYVIYVQKNPPMKFRGRVTNLVMFLLTIVSTIWAGAVLWAPFTGFIPDDFPGDILMVLVDAELMFYGFLYFALPLLLILGVHEFGHYFMAKRHNVDASLPFFIPVPPIIGPLGTFGAFISLREPIPNRRALLEIGAAGPIAGFIIAIPVTLIGLYLTSVDPIYAPGIGGQDFLINEPLLFAMFTWLIPIPSGATLHPVAFAGWVGLLVTAFNLLPAGQLDGGHIARALFGDKAKYLSYAVIVLLLALAVWTKFLTWGLFAFLILLMGANHPPPLNDLSPLKNMDKLAGVACAVIMIFCFHPLPIVVETPSTASYDVDLVSDSTFKSISQDQTAIFQMNITNTGNTGDEYYFTFEALALDADLSNDFVLEDLTNFSLLGAPEPELQGWSIRIPWNQTLELDDDETGMLTMEVNATDSLQIGSGLALRVKVVSQSDSSIQEEVTHFVKLNTFGFFATESQGVVIRKTIAPYTVVVTNPKYVPLDVGFSYKIIHEDAPTRGWTVELNRTGITVPAESQGSINVYVKAPVEVFKGNTVVVRVYAEDLSTGETAMTDLTTTIEKTDIAGEN